MFKVSRNALILTFALLFVAGTISAQKGLLPYSEYMDIRDGISNTLYKIQKDKQATIAFLGGSITYNSGWRDMTCEYLKEIFPDTKFRFINAGIPSLGSLPDAYRVKTDVLDSGEIDLMFIEAAVNDRVNYTDSITQIRSLEGIVRQARTVNPRMDIIIMSFAGPAKNQDYETGKEPIEVGNHEVVAAHYQLPSINIAKEVFDNIQDGRINWKRDIKSYHPAPFGQQLYFENIKELITKCREKSLPDSKIYLLPTPLDRHNFSGAEYYSIQNAKLKDGWHFEEKWKPDDNVATRKGFVAIPMIVADASDATLQLSFRGTAIGLAVVSGPSTGIIRYSIDGSPYKEIDLFTQWSTKLYLPWYVMLAENLEKKNHVLTLKMAETKNPKSKGNSCHIAYFLLNK